MKKKDNSPRTFTLNAAQAAASRSKSTETFLIGGVGLGKSFFLAMQLLRALRTPGVVCGLFAPSVKLLRNATLKQVQEAWKMFGFRPQEDFVINTLPPKDWGITPYSELTNTKILTTRWESYCICDGLDNYDSQRGVEFDEIFVDEFRDINTEARDVLLARLRGPRYIAMGIPHRIWYATTPPDDVRYLNELLHDSSQDIEFHFGGTFLNERNLPKNYIESMRHKYDDLTFRREVMGELVAATNSLFLWSFNRTLHVKTCDINYDYPVYLSFDFNVNPMTCIAAQHYKGIKIVANFIQYDSDIVRFCRQLIFPFLYNEVVRGHSDSQRFPRVFVTGDPSGTNRSPGTQKNTNFFTSILASLRLNQSNLKVLSGAPTHASSYILCNSILQRHGDFGIDYRCNDLIYDMESLQVVNGMQINKKDPDVGHLVDCLRYYLHVWHGNFINNEYRNRNININLDSGN